MTEALKTYRAKRDFSLTPEPAEGGEEGGESRAFVVQKHWASRLHYDLRLELDGVMKSWAVPKGPSYDPRDKRMAVQVEDHPIAYNQFEGEIPAGQYGAGKVIIWDKGHWRPLGEPRRDYADGELKFELHGHKLRGRWVLVRMKDGKAWLLIKERDEFARPALEFSVVDEMPDSVSGLPAPTPTPAAAATAASVSASVRVRAEAATSAAARAAVPSALPATLAPQLATLVDQPPATPQDWLFEIKFDGYRPPPHMDGKRQHANNQGGAMQSKSAIPQPQPQPQGKLPASLKVSNPERVIDAVSGTSKIGLVRYYALVGELMLPHLKGRPLSLVRAPSGVGGELFFQKHADTGRLAGVRQLDRALDPGHPPMLAVASVEGLLAAAQWNVVEFHTQNACAKSYDTPNRIVFDLDPGKGVAWPQVREAALLTRAFLQELGLEPWLKTSGGKGLHLVVPIRPHYDWDTVKAFSQAVVAHMAATMPERFVLKSGPSNRVGRIYIDYLRNGRGSTTVCAWSARARPGLPISVPLDWDELVRVDSGEHWTVATAHQRLDVGNAPWDGYAKGARGLAQPMRRLGFAPPSSDKPQAKT
ncbi:hypothetical protein CSQ96_16585 [Janthinobacterium sp. BJB412]|nr:hypothetical protein CSQ96_16585 [Janthinobacterium sp. BJB412]